MWMVFFVDKGFLSIFYRLSIEFMTLSSGAYFLFIYFELFDTLFSWPTFSIFYTVLDKTVELEESEIT